MAHKTKINGTAYDISGGKTLIGGTSYDISGGKTLVGGTAYDVGFSRPVTITCSGTFARQMNAYGGYVAAISINGGAYTTMANGLAIQCNTGDSVSVWCTGFSGGSYSGNWGNITYNSSAVSNPYTFIIKRNCTITGATPANYINASITH